MFKKIILNMNNFDLVNIVKYMPIIEKNIENSVLFFIDYEKD